MKARDIEKFLIATLKLMFYVAKAVVWLLALCLDTAARAWRSHRITRVSRENGLDSTKTALPGRTDWKKPIAALLVVVGLVTFFAVTTVVKQARQKARYSQLAVAIPGLRYFPGWGHTDNSPWHFQRCLVPQVAFRSAGMFLDPEVTVEIQNPSTAATQPSLSVCLYDLDGNMVGWSQPVDFKRTDFQPFDSRTMPDYIQGSNPTQPSFYVLYELPVPNP